MLDKQILHIMNRYEQKLIELMGKDDFAKRADLHSTDIMKERAKNCPLVELPPHGRLIDADALLKEAEVPATLFPSGRGLRLEVWTHAVASGDVINAPTIIPESEECER